MKTKTPFLAAAVFVAASVFGLGVADVAAQGRFVTQYSKRDVSDIIRRIEENSDEFRTDFRRAMNNSNLDKNTRNRFNTNVANSETAIDALRRHFDRQDSWWNSRSQVQSVINASQDLNTMMRRLPFRRQLERQWNQLRNQINRVADTYDLAGLDGGGRQGGGNPGGNPGENPGAPGMGPTTRPPNWMIGTFYSAYPPANIATAANGQVQMNIGGQIYYGRYYRGSIYGHDDNSVTSVIRLGNGLRTVNRSTGRTIDFTQNSEVGSGGGGNEGSVSAPPSWAVGTFVANNRTVRMTISRQGRVTFVNNDTSSSGRYYFGSLYLDGQVWTITQDRNGIRTSSRNGGSYNFRRL
jgi:hypothetical protein